VTYTLHNGDCLDMLPTLPEADAIVTDPPSGIGFMGAEWDSDKGGREAWVAWLAARLRAARLRPGGYALVWALPRTSHWTACAIEDAGFVIQDRLAHIFGSGFPKHKSHLKPAVEDWWLAYNPGGARALNVEACRVEGIAEKPGGRIRATRHYSGSEVATGYALVDAPDPNPAGRWPPHLLLTHSEACDAACAPDCPVQILGEQSGERPTGPGGITKYVESIHGPRGLGSRKDRTTIGYADTGTAARFFPQFRYAAKASRKEREQGLEGFDLHTSREWRTGNAPPNVTHRVPDKQARNTHPTVKNLALMRWLVRLVTPAGGLVLDPFAGSGSTGCAAVLEGMRFQGVEMDPTYAEIARARIAHYADPLRHMEAA
jgi:DNA modification methylase